MKKSLKKMLILPVYGIYYVVVEWILGAGTKDPWDKMWEWSEK